MTEDDERRLRHIVERCAALAAEVKGYKDDIKTCADEHKELATVARRRPWTRSRPAARLQSRMRPGINPVAQCSKLA